MSVLVLVALTGCPILPDDLFDGADNGSVDDAFWNLVLPDESIVTGTSVQKTSNNTILMSASTPAGWSVLFTTEDPVALSTHYRSDTVTDRVSGTITNPSNATCTVDAGAAGAVVWLNVGDTLDPVPGGQAGFEASCFGLGDGAYAMLFGQ